MSSVVGYLPGEQNCASIRDGQRAGVAQASREESGANVTVAVEGNEAVVIQTPSSHRALPPGLVSIGNARPALGIHQRAGLGGEVALSAPGAP